MENDNSCCICFQEYSNENYILKDGNLNHQFCGETYCSHWFCTKCLKILYLEMKVTSKNSCPLCRDDISNLLETYKTDSSKYDSSNSSKSGTANKTITDDEKYEKEDDEEIDKDSNLYSYKDIIGDSYKHTLQRK
jgi:hypothetical protein